MSQNKDIRITGTDACQKYKLKSTVVNSNLIYLFNKSDHIKYGTPSPLDFKDEIRNRINNFLNKIQNQCIVCSLQFYARDCINKCCGTCCKDQKCTRHRHK